LRTSITQSYFIIEVAVCRAAPGRHVPTECRDE